MNRLHYYIWEAVHTVRAHTRAIWRVLRGPQ
jgi:hypothetical protein